MADRVDASGKAYAGSQLQTQLYVNEHPKELNRALASEFQELAGATIRWQSPLKAEGYREYQDEEFLDRIGLRHHATKLKDFWPSGGPVWDALAQVDRREGPGVILVEGKSYEQELYGRGCQASPRSREQIDAALARTRAWLGSTSAAPEAWTGSLYQSANRLAHLYFLNELLGVRSWLVHLLFVDDPHSPTHADKSDKAIQAADTELGLEQDVLRAGYVLLPAVSADISP